MRGHVLAALTLALVAAAYAAALPGPYQFDDFATVAIDPGARSLAGWWSGVATHVRPLTKGTFALGGPLGEALGHAPLGHRVGNIAIHLGVVVLFMALGRRVAAACLPRLAPGDAATAAILAAALFGLHPFATEAVSYISGRSVSLGTLLAVASLVAWLRGRETGRPALRVGSLALFALAVLARETTALSVPVLVAALEIARADPAAPAFGVGRVRTAALAAVPFCGLTLVAAAWMLAHARYADLLQLSRWIAAAHAHDASLLTAIAYFVASALVLRYPNIDPAVDAAAPGILLRIAAALALAALFWTAWRSRGTRPHWLLGALWALAWLVPIYALPVRHDAIAERHFYPALWGLAFPLAVELALRLSAAGRTALAARGACAILLLGLLAATSARNLDYRSEVALWESAARGSPDKVRVLNNLGYAYMASGRWDEAAAALARATEIDPNDLRARWNLRAARARDLRVIEQPAFVE